MSRFSGPVRSVSNPNVHKGNDTNTSQNNGFICQSGSLGSISSPPTDAFIVRGASNAAATYTLTLVNASMGQATVLTVPDPASATANMNVSAAALVSGNLVSASGTAGLTQDSGVSSSSVSSAITQLGTVQEVSVTLSASQMAAAYATPATLIAAPGATKVIQIIQASVYTNSTGQTPLATGTAPIIQYGTTTHGGGTLATSSGLVAGDITAATSQVRNLGAMATAASTGLSNNAITFSNATGAYTAGTGTTVTFSLVYRVLTATI